MPTLNYLNAGAVVSYNYLHGTITAIDYDYDTADVSGACGSLSGVPIFYHCSDGVTERSNGALEGAALGFTIGDEVVVIVGIDDENSLGERYFVIGHYNGVQPCSRDLAFVQATHLSSGDRPRTLIFYDHDGVAQRTVDLNEILGIPYNRLLETYGDARVYIQAAYGHMNAVMLSAWVNDWRGYIGRVEDYTYGHYSTHFPVKIPLTVFENEAPQFDYTGVWQAKAVQGNYFLSRTGGSQYFNAQPWYAGYDDSLYYKILHGESLSTIVSEDTSLPKAMTDKWTIGVQCLTAYLNYFIAPIAKWSNTDGFIDGYIGIWSLPISSLWYENEGMGGFWSSGTRIASISSTLDWESFRFIHGYGDKIYVFKQGVGYSPTPPATIDVYNFDWELVQTGQPHEYLSGYDSVNIVTYNGRVVFCCRLVDVWRDFGTDYYGPMVIIDPLTLAVIKSIDFSQYTMMAYNVPVQDYMIDKTNAVRKIATPVTRSFISEEDYLQPIGYVGRDLILSRIAQDHVSWLASHCQYSHEGIADALVSDRASPYGYRDVGENLMLLTALPTIQEEIDVCVEAWVNSPPHYATMTSFNNVSMGWASATIPVTCTSIRVGTGSPAVWSTLDVPPSLRGKYRIYCQVFSIG